jgi:hypothetical protein
MSGAIRIFPNEKLEEYALKPKTLTNIRPGNRAFQKSGYRSKKHLPADDSHRRGINTHTLRQYQMDQAPKDFRRKSMNYSTKNTTV